MTKGLRASARSWRSWTVIGVGFVLVLSACSSTDDTTTTTQAAAATTTTAAPETTTTVAETTTTEAEEETTTTEPVEITGRGDGVLTLARVLPETGFLDYLGGPMIAGVGLAVEDINAAGGVLGADVVLLEFDSGTDPAVAVPNVNSGLAQGADVIIGAAASGITQAFLDTLNQNGVPNCSPSATSPSFNDQANASIMYRTVPPDEFVAPIIADEIVNDGNGDNVVIVARSDDYGSALAGLVGENLEALNATVATTIQYTDETTFASEADDIVGANPSAVVIISFREAATLLGLLVDQGLDPSTFYGADGVFSGQLPALVGGDASVIDGMKVIGASGSDEFNNRLADEGVTDFIYGGQGYDCAVITALWAASEGTDDTTTWDPQTLLDLTDSGTVCTTFADCIVLVEAGEDVDYDGQSGPLSLAPGNPGGDGNLGNPTFTVYSVARYEDGGVLTPFSDTVVDLR
jgi:branched-chain amino acid transport system substrate-binding protein